jgi:hypothetical protein
MGLLTPERRAEITISAYEDGRLDFMASSYGVPVDLVSMQKMLAIVLRQMQMSQEQASKEATQLFAQGVSG